MEEIVTAQIYCDALDKYLYYFDRGTPALRPPLSALFTTQDTILTRTRTRTDCTEIHRVARRAHHVVHRHHLHLVLVVPPPVAADRRDRVPRDDPASFPRHIAAYLWQEDVGESGAVCQGGGGGRIFEDGDHAGTRGPGCPGSLAISCSRQTPSKHRIVSVFQLRPCDWFNLPLVKE